MVKLSVYFDESYNHPTKKEPDLPLVYTVAGYLSTAQQWKGFEKEWNKALKSEGIEFFHMAHFESRIGLYENWSNEKRVGFLQKLHAIIHKYVLKSFATSLILSDYGGLTENQKYVFGEPHLCALFSCMKHIVTMCDEFNFIEPIDYVFETSDYNGKIKSAFSNLPNEDAKGYRIGSVSFCGKNTTPLQASDILSYEVTKELARQRSVDKRPVRKSIKNLSFSQDEWFYMSKEHFLEVLSFVKEKGLYDGEV